MINSNLLILKKSVLYTTYSNLITTPKVLDQTN